MRMLADFFPIILFFIAYKFYGIYAATAVAMAASITQVIIFWVKNRRVEIIHIITMLLILVLGGATLVLHDEWKPTAINWSFALVFFASQLFGNKPLIQRMMEENISLPNKIWSRLNSSWALFFAIMGIANLYVIYHFDTNTWVNFKLFGVLGLTVVFVLVQAVYLTRHIIEPNQK